MFIHPNPLFRFSDLLPGRGGDDLSKVPWTLKENDSLFIYSRGQWALKRIGSGVLKSRNKTKGTILIPEYFCEISLTPLRTAEFDIRFYRITPELEPDITDLERMVKAQGPPDIMLFVHYFGMPLNIGPTENWCRENGVVLIEDAANSLFSVPGIGAHACPTRSRPGRWHLGSRAR